MSLWDSIKGIVPKLVDMKNQLVEGKLYILSKHYEINFPAGTSPSELRDLRVTEQLEEEYKERLRVVISSLESRLSTLSGNEVKKEIARASVSTAREIIRTRVNIELPMPEIHATATVDDDNYTRGEGANP